MSSAASGGTLPIQFSFLIILADNKSSSGPFRRFLLPKNFSIYLNSWMPKSSLYFCQVFPQKKGISSNGRLKLSNSQTLRLHPRVVLSRLRLTKHVGQALSSTRRRVIIGNCLSKLNFRFRNDLFYPRKKPEASSDFFLIHERLDNIPTLILLILFRRLFWIWTATSCISAQYWDDITEVHYQEKLPYLTQS